MPKRGGARLVAPLAAAALSLGSASAAPQPAGIVRLEITSVESPTFEGRAFGAVGPYEKLRGRAYGEIDPNDPRNATIADLKLAPRNAR